MPEITQVEIMSNLEQVGIVSKLVLLMADCRLLNAKRQAVNKLFVVEKVRYTLDLAEQLHIAVTVESKLAKTALKRVPNFKLELINYHTFTVEEQKCRNWVNMHLKN